MLDGDYRKLLSKVPFLIFKGWGFLVWGCEWGHMEAVFGDNRFFLELPLFPTGIESGWQVIRVPFWL